MNKKEILQNALVARDQEIFGYQINIDNYSLAIQQIKQSADAELFPFMDDLEKRLSAERLEQKKSKLIREVIAKQLEEMK